MKQFLKPLQSQCLFEKPALNFAVPPSPPTHTYIEAHFTVKFAWLGGDATQLMAL